MTKPSLWARIKAKFQKQNKLEEIKEKSKATLHEARIQVAKQVWKARVAVRRLRYRDKRKIPIFLLTFEEIEKMMKETIISLPKSD